MVEESFMLISLKEDQSKDLAQVISNKTARAMLEHLANKEFATESEMAKDLGVPLSTVHYNCKALIKSGLVLADEYHYSQKGKEVPHYKLAKKFIIIAPKEESKSSLMERMKKFLPLGGLAVVGAGIIEAVKWWQSRAVDAGGEMMLMAKDAAVDAAPEAMRTMALEAPPAAVQAAGYSPSPLALGFLIGGLVLVAAFAFYDFLKK